MRRLLTNTFGFESNCWVCEPSNPVGLHVPFHHDDQAHTVMSYSDASAYSDRSSITTTRNPAAATYAAAVASVRMAEVVSFTAGLPDQGCVLPRR